MGIIKKRKQPDNKRGQGFTIIEVMIVLAIAGLILAIVFLALPQLRQNQRDHQRKEYARSIYAGLVELHSNSGGLPVCPFIGATPQQCAQAPGAAERFITGAMPKAVDPTTGENYTDDTTINVAKNFYGDVCSGVATPSKSTIYCWDDRLSGGTPFHDRAPRVGQIVIFAAHLCNNGEVSGNAIIRDQSPGVPNYDDVFAVSIGLEKGEFCISNGT